MRFNALIAMIYEVCFFLLLCTDFNNFFFQYKCQGWNSQISSVNKKNICYRIYYVILIINITLLDKSECRC